MRRALVLLIIVLLTGCGQPSGTASGDKLQVVATTSILGDLVAQVGGEHIALTTLAGPGADAHTFEPAPADAVKLGDAKVIFEVGLGFEGWLDNLVSSSGSDATRVNISEGLELLEAGEEEHHEGEEETEDEHGHGEFDPHVWHDVNNAIAMVEAIRDALAQADPANAATYQANAEQAIAQLRTLDQWVVEQVSTLPEERRRLVTSHDTFGYFAQRYGFEIVGTALGSTSTEAGDPAAGELAALIEEIRASGVPAIFAENVHNPALMQRIADEAGVTLAPPLLTDALSEQGGPGATYEQLIRYNVTTIVEALR